MSIDSIYWAKGEIECLLLNRQKVEQEYLELQLKLSAINAEIVGILREQKLDEFLLPNLDELHKWLQE